MRYFDDLSGKQKHMKKFYNKFCILTAFIISNIVFNDVYAEEHLDVQNIHDEAVAALQESDLSLNLDTHDIYPSLENRALGEPLLDDETGEIKQWGRSLPFLAQDVINLGFDLPNPYGFAVIPGWIEQDLVLENLAISVNNGPRQDIEFVDFGTPSVQNETVQFKADAWLFPFMNVYATVGFINGDATIPITVEGEDLLGFLGLGGVCAVAPALRPGFCFRTLNAIASPNYHGENFSVGINLAMGWDRYFVTLPITYAWSRVNIIDTTVEAINISPRFGVIGDIGASGKLAVFVGAMYLDTSVDLTGSVSFDTSNSGVPGVGDTTTVDFLITQTNKDKWNLLLGFNWDINKNWSLQGESGFGGSRDSFISSMTYRF